MNTLPAILPEKHTPAVDNIDDASLIASALELLAFAKEAAYVLDYYAQFKQPNGKPDPAIVSLIDQAEAVIAKAEDRS